MEGVGPLAALAFVGAAAAGAALLAAAALLGGWEDVECVLLSMMAVGSVEVAFVSDAMVFTLYLLAFAFEVEGGGEGGGMYGTYLSDNNSRYSSIFLSICLIYDSRLLFPVLPSISAFCIFFRCCLLALHCFLLLHCALQALVHFAAPQQHK